MRATGTLPFQIPPAIAPSSCTPVVGICELFKPIKFSSYRKHSTFPSIETETFFAQPA